MQVPENWYIDSNKTGYNPKEKTVMSYAEINNEFVEKIEEELERLGLSDWSVESVDEAEAVVKISVAYYADQVLEIFEYMDMDPDENVWKAIAKAKI